jgi:hypothetical protein
MPPIVRATMRQHLGHVPDHPLNLGHLRKTKSKYTTHIYILLKSLSQLLTVHTRFQKLPLPLGEGWGEGSKPQEV